MNVGSIKDFKEGCADAIPICLGYIAVSFAFGIDLSLLLLSSFGNDKFLARFCKEPNEGDILTIGGRIGARSISSELIIFGFL